MTTPRKPDADEQHTVTSGRSAIGMLRVGCCPTWKTDLHGNLQHSHWLQDG